ncbi:hypothetical protein [Actibacterium sp. XHP0104]|uniref:hypothetical protein n=1 Tax=Actibacterium sp. XHP0104 TaxID=2984335 RepID=UPI0021E83380|nr:hypothetical protein [Actibacterium sp. XHP0104]MCV2881996.1 hypothetical protein [Actibacterium sp. XHP0104]
MTIPVVFLYARGHATRGSVVMRCFQFAEMAQTLLGQDYSFRTIALPRKGTGGHLEAVQGINGAVVVLVKALIQHLDPEAMDHLKAHNRAILADWIDKALRSPHTDQIDIHIASSRAQEQALRNRFPQAEIRHVTHHADPRLMGQSFGALADLRCCYLGRRENAPELPGAEGRIDWLDAQTSQGFEDLLGRLPNYNLHLAARAEPADPRIHKPFTKGFTAALCRSNILVPRDVPDAVHYLGADYPFLLDDDRPETVMQGLSRAAEAFGSPEWHRGLAVMAQIMRLSSPSHVMGEFGAILSEITGLPLRQNMAPPQLDPVPLTA